MPRISLRVDAEDLAQELSEVLDPTDTEHFILDLVAGLPTRNLRYLIHDLSTTYTERQEMELD